MQLATMMAWTILGMCPRGVMVKAMDCGIVVSEFVLQFTQSAGSYPSASLQRGKTPNNECPRYDTKQSDGEVPAMQELWGMQSTPSLPSVPGPLWPGVVAPDRALSIK